MSKKLKHSDDIIDSLNYYYSWHGDVNTYIKCLEWVWDYTEDVEIRDEIFYINDFMGEYELEHRTNEDMSIEILEALQETKKDDVKLYADILAELSEYSKTINSYLEDTIIEYRLCPECYSDMAYKNPYGDCINPYENGYMECSKCGYIID